MILGVFGELGHGKSSLVSALTDPNEDGGTGDQRFERSTELTFHSFINGDGKTISVLDAPGHPRYLKQFVAGVLSTDVAIVCIDVQAGVTLATLDQLQMLKLRRVPAVLFAFTKCDLADSHRQTFLETELRKCLEGSPYKESVIVPVSSKSGDGMDLLKVVIDQVMAQVEFPALTDWLINVWSVAGNRSSVSLVSGLLEGGDLNSDDPAELLPSPGPVSLASVRTSMELVQTAERGSLVVVELRGVDRERLDRGYILTKRGIAKKVGAFAFKPRWAGEPKTNVTVKVYVGLVQVMAKLTWDKFDSHIAKLELKDELYVAVGQQILVTKPGPNAWLAGGTISSITIEQHKLGDSLRFAEVTNLEEGILAAVHEDPDGVTTEEICRLIGRSPQQLGNAFESLIASKQLVGFAGLWYKPAVFISQANKFLAALDEMHEAQPSVLSHEREAVVKRAQLNWFGKHLDRMMTNLEELGKISLDGKRIKRSDFKLRLRQHQIAFLERVIEELDLTMINNPYPSEIASKLGTPVQSVEEIMQLGVLSGHLVQLSSSLLYSHNQLQRLREKTVELFGHEEFTAIEFKDALSSSRKFAIPILDYFDATGFTERKTEKRRVRKI